MHFAVAKAIENPLASGNRSDITYSFRRIPTNQHRAGHAIRTGLHIINMLLF